MADSIVIDRESHDAGCTCLTCPARQEVNRLTAEIERLRAENDALRIANHEAMWDDTLIPIGEALGVTMNDEHGVPRRHFQMVEAIIKEARRG